MDDETIIGNTGAGEEQKDFLWLHVKDLPYFRSLLRAVEARFYQDIELPTPTLDIGCGDGHFASVAFDRQIDVGIDPWWEPLREAQKWGGYHSLIAADGARVPFPDGYFASAISNSAMLKPFLYFLLFISAS